MENPALFGPVVAAVVWNVYVAMKEGNKLSEADYQMRKASTDFLANFDEAAQLRVDRGIERRTALDVHKRLNESKQLLADVTARYRRMGEIVMPLLIVANAALIDKADSDFMAHFVEAATYSSQLSMELTELIKQVTSMQRALKPIVDLVETVNQFRENGEIQPELWDIEMNDVRFGPLSVQNLKITHGDFLTVVGECGSGKSALLKLLYGFSPERGILMIDDNSASKVDKRRYREHIAVSNQFPVVETKSLRENIAIDGLPFQEDVFQKLSSDYGFDDFFTKHAKKPDELIFNKDVRLSGGEKKLLSFMAIDYRLSVAPETVKMIILDEPTSGIDHRRKKQIFKMIQRWHQEHPDVTIVVVNHDPDWFDDLPDQSRILGIAKNGKLTQDETLEQARKHSTAPFNDLFGEKIQ